MDISIVSGTYNRLSYLKKMVQSARQSLGYNLRHEFVLVDGGSTDGTQEWCAEQDDIRLIQHEGLLGAVKAFNDGARAARGDYVILANDDIEFLDNTILLGWLYMQQHPDCGIGCLFQDRNKKDWHVEPMHIVKDDKQTSGPYGQVCIVLRWLGNEVGWWGDYLHTYGGDNEISSSVYETGFKVSPVPGTKIHDCEADDELRRKNNISGAHDPRAVQGAHPDSIAWGRHWRWRDKKTGQVFVGANVPDKPKYENPIMTKERIIYLPIYEPGFPVQKEQKRGLRLALEKVGLVVEIDYVSTFHELGKGALIQNIKNHCQEINPTLIITQLHNGANIDADDIADLRNYASQATLVNWNGDFWPENLLSEDGIKLAMAFDLQTTINREVLDEYRKRDIKAEYWQIGYEPDGVGHKPEVSHDVVFLATGYSKERQRLGKFLNGIGTQGMNFGLYGAGWPNAKGECLYDFKTACKIYKGAKISIGDSQWPESGFVSNRVFQAMAAGGSLLMHQWFKGMGELGLIDGETCGIWREFNELADKIRYYLEHEDERKQIALRGEQMTLQHHSFDARVEELLKMLGKRETKERWESWR